MAFYRRCGAIIIALFILWAAKPAFAAIHVLAGPGIDPAHLAMVQKSADTFNEVIKAELDLTLLRDVPVYVCTREIYHNVITREMAADKLRITAQSGVPADLRPTTETFRKAINHEAPHEIKDEERIARLTGGFSLSNELVAINMDLSGGVPAGDRAYRATAHELFHLLEYQLAGENANKAPYWLKEGVAGLIAALVAEKIGYQSLDNWKHNQLDVLRKAGRHASVQEMLAAGLHGWPKMIAEKMYPYQMADLMVFYLMTQSKAGGYKTVVEYYSLLDRGLPNAAAFERAFGLPPAEMLAGFPAWLAVVSTR